MNLSAGYLDEEKYTRASAESRLWVPGSRFAVLGCLGLETFQGVSTLLHTLDSGVKPCFVGADQVRQQELISL